MRGKYFLVADQIIFMLEPGINPQPKIFYPDNKEYNSEYGKVIYPFFNNKCLIFLRYKFISIIPIKPDLTHGSPEKIDISRGGYYVDLSPLENGRFLVLNSDGHLALLEVKMENFEKIKDVDFVRETKIQGAYGYEEDERPLAMAMSEDERYFMVTFGVEFTKISTSVGMYRIDKGGKFVHLKDFKMKNQKIRLLKNLVFLRFYWDYLLFAAIGNGRKTNQLVFLAYDIKKNEIFEVRELRKSLDLHEIRRFVHRDKGEFVGISRDNKLLRIRVED